MLHEGTRYGVSVLADGQAGLSDRFAGREREEVPEPRFVTVRETPLVDGALAHLVARVVRSYWGGDHSLFLGQVEYARYGEGRPSSTAASTSGSSTTRASSRRLRRRCSTHCSRAARR